ncbi:MAG: signal peptidase I [Chloroflexota bacterium]
MYTAFRDLAETVITAVLIFIVLQIATQTFRVEGTSMHPTLENGQHVMVNKFVYAGASDGVAGDLLRVATGTDEDSRAYVFHGPQRGDIIVFHPPTSEREDFVKRVIGVPGDVVDIRGGTVYVNGRALDEEFPVTEDGIQDFPLEVTDGHFFVLGDNRPRSNDSRSWGLVPAENVVGRVWFTYWPPSDFRIFAAALGRLAPGVLIP